MKNTLCSLFVIALISICSCKKDNSKSSPSNVDTLPASYISAMINGEKISGTSTPVRGLELNYTDSSINKKIYINIGSWYNNASAITTAPLGDYDLSTYTYIGTIGNPSYASYSIGGHVYTTDASHTGTLTVTSGGNVVTGTFSFTAVDTAGHTIYVSNGIINKVAL